MITRRMFLLPLILFVAAFGPMTACAQDVTDVPSYLRNERFRVLGETAIITYELVAQRDKVFNVSVELRRLADEAFVRRPVSLSGAVGRVVPTVGIQEIRWAYKKDYPDGFQGSDYYFQIVAEEIVAEKSSDWWKYALGGAGLVVGIVYAVTASKTVAEPPAVPTLPDPPQIVPQN